VNKIKIIASGWENYNADFGGVLFENSISVEPVTRAQINRISAMVLCELVDEDGKPIEQAGNAARGVALASVQVPVSAGLQRQTEKEKANELKLAALQSDKPPYRIMTKEELEGVATAGGIKGLRTVAEHWNVHDRKITNMIREILKAQEVWKARYEEKLAEQRRDREVALEQSLEIQRLRDEQIDREARNLEKEAAEKVEKAAAEKAAAEKAAAEGLSNAIGEDGKNALSIDKPEPDPEATAETEKDDEVVSNRPDDAAPPVETGAETPPPPAAAAGLAPAPELEKLELVPTPELKVE
jgi:hypothetical protein